MQLNYLELLGAKHIQILYLGYRIVLFRDYALRQCMFYTRSNRLTLESLQLQR